MVELVFQAHSLELQLSMQAEAEAEITRGLGQALVALVLAVTEWGLVALVTLPSTELMLLLILVVVVVVGLAIVPSLQALAGLVS